MATPVILVLVRWRLEASLIYTVSVRLAWAIGNIVSKYKQNNDKNLKAFATPYQMTSYKF